MRFSTQPNKTWATYIYCVFITTVTIENNGNMYWQATVLRFIRLYKLRLLCEKFITLRLVKNSNYQTSIVEYENWASFVALGVKIYLNYSLISPPKTIAKILLPQSDKLNTMEISKKKFLENIRFKSCGKIFELSLDNCRTLCSQSVLTPQTGISRSTCFSDFSDDVWLHNNCNFYTLVAYVQPEPLTNALLIFVSFYSIYRVFTL